MTSNITFDISPRRSGKTRRLKQHIVEYLNQDETHTVDLISYSRMYSVEISRSICEIIPSFRYRITCYGNTNQALSRVYYHHINNTNNMIFFDESDLIDHKFLYDRCYFCTTSVNNSTINLQSQVLQTQATLPTQPIYGFEVERREIQARSRALRGTWTIDQSNDVFNNTVSELSNVIDEEVLQMMYDVNNREEEGVDLSDDNEEELFLIRTGII